MDTAILSSIISAAAAILVCMINNHFTLKRTEKTQQDNIVLISYRLEQLEQKVDRHNNLVNRMYEVEKRTDVLEEKQRVANHRIDDLEKHIDDVR